MREYLRPQTLYSEKFEAYLQASIEWHQAGRPDYEKSQASTIEKLASNVRNVSQESLKPDSCEKSQSLSRKKQEAITTRVWQRMAEIFGSAWTSQYGAVGEGAWQTWCKALSGLEMETVAAGVNRVISEKPKFPPNLQNFWLCAGRTGAATQLTGS